MNRIIERLARLSAIGFMGLSTSAFAQSTVTLYGTVDVNGRYVKADGQQRHLTESSGGLNSSQLGFRGSEDLGDGLRVGFNLQGDIFVDTGTTNATKFFSRISTLNVSSKWGELRLGRDYTPTFLVLSLIDPMGYISLGSGLNVRQLYNGSRQDNAIEYWTPAIAGGFFGQAMVTASEGGTELDRPTRYIGGRAGYTAGPASIVFGTSQSRYAAPFGVGGNTVSTTTAVVQTKVGDTQKNYSMNASWNFGFVKLAAAYDHEKLDDYRERVTSLYATIPFGVSEVHGGYDRSSLRRPNGTSTAVDQIKATYVYNLSKRSAIYVTAVQLDNKDATRLTLPGATAPTVAGGKSRGAEFGVRHFF